MEELRQWKETGGRVALGGDGKFDSPGEKSRFFFVSHNLGLSILYILGDHMSALKQK